MVSTQNDSQLSVVVVDSRPVDYTIAASWAKANDIEFRYLLCGRDALRMAAAANGSLWMINVELPDMTGFDLLEMLHVTLKDPFVVMVSDQYQPQHELRSGELNVPCYVCKPLEAQWFDTLLHGLTRESNIPQGRRRHKAPREPH